MSHWIIAPVVLPVFAGLTILLFARTDLRRQRWIAGIACLALLGVAVRLLLTASHGGIEVYRLGDWPAPFGIVLVLDRLSALMVALTALLGLLAHLHAIHGADRGGPNYHALFQFQLMGLCGAFLTGDLFNLFVFFEVLLISSYGLLLYQGNRRRLVAGIHYVVFNLVGSALFLVGVGTLYGVLGTLNMADLSVRVAEASAEAAPLIQAGGLLLLVVFAVKAALLPLYFWLPSTYGSAAAPVAALFAIMTKVGVYCIVRVYTLVFGSAAGLLSGIAWDWVLPAALATLATGTLGALAARRLGGLAAYLVIGSVGTMLTAVALATPASLAAAIYYMTHSTVVLAGLFLLADLIARQRGEDDRLVRADAVTQPALLGGMFLLGGVAAAGLPPLSGFIGKVLVLQSALEAPATGWVYGVVLVTSLLTLVAIARAGSQLFWNVEPHSEDPPGQALPRASATELLPAAMLLAMAAALAAFAGPAVEYAQATAEQLTDPHRYVDAILTVDPESLDLEPGGEH